VSLPLGVAATKLALIGCLFVANFVVSPLQLGCSCCDHISVVLLARCTVVALLSVVAGRLEALSATCGMQRSLIFYLPLLPSCCAALFGRD